MDASKAQVTVRLDADVLAWLRAGGAGWQTRLNAILRAEMDASGGAPDPQGDAKPARTPRAKSSASEPVQAASAAVASIAPKVQPRPARVVGYDPATGAPLYREGR